MCVFKAPRTLDPVLRALVSPRGTRERLKWHPAVGCGDDASPCEWANACGQTSPSYCTAQDALSIVCTSYDAILARYQGSLQL